MRTSAAATSATATTSVERPIKPASFTTLNYRRSFGEDGDRCAKEKPLQPGSQRLLVKIRLRILCSGNLARARAHAIARMIAHVRINRRTTDGQGLRIIWVTGRNVTNRALVWAARLGLHCPKRKRKDNASHNGKSESTNSAKQLRPI